MVELRNEIEATEQQLVHVRGAVRNLEFILGVEMRPPVANVSGEEVLPGVYVYDPATHEPGLRAISNDDDSDPDNGDSEIDRDDGGDDRSNEAPRQPRRIKRTRSTEWIAEIINKAGRPMTRDEIYAEYELQKGFPESWTSPRNSLGNALGRAVANKWVVRMPDDRFIGADMFANHFGLEGDDGA